MAAAGAAKLRDLPGSRRAMEGFGVPPRLAPAAGVALPIAELAIAVLLVTTSLTTAGAVLAFCLLLVMTAAITRLVVRGESPDCHCFGAVHSQPVGRSTLVRSAAFAGLAAFVAVYGTGSDIGELGPFGLEALVPLAVAIAVFVVGEPGPRRHRPLFPDAPPPGSPAPRFELPYAREGRASLDSLLERGGVVALVFVDTGCGPCRRLLGSLAKWRQTIGTELAIAVISKGDRTANQVLCHSTGIPDVLLQEDSEVARAYGVLPTPSAILVAADGTVGSAPVAGPHGIEALIRLALAGQVTASPVDGVQTTR
jgi:peroxiredoxin